MNVASVAEPMTSTAAVRMPASATGIASGTTTRKNRWLRRAPTEAAWAASRTKKSYLGARYRRLAARRGKKRALVAVGHSLLVIFYPMLSSDVEYQDLGVEYFDRLEPERLRRYLVKRLEGLGYQVTLTTQDEAA